MRNFSRSVSGMRMASVGRPGTGPAARAGRRVDDVGVGSVVGHGQVNSLACRRPALKPSRTSTGQTGTQRPQPTQRPGSTQEGCCLTVPGTCRAPPRSRSPPWRAGCRCSRETAPGAGNAARRRRAGPAAASGTCRSDPSETGSRAGSGCRRCAAPGPPGHPIPILGQVEGRPDTCDPGADHHGCADSTFHAVLHPTSRRPTAG